MRSFIIKSSLITGFIILSLVTSGIAVGVLAPLHPGNLLFPIQNFVEQKMSLIFPDPASKATYMLDLFERRINDLEIRTGTRYELKSLEYLDVSMEQAMLAISLTSDETASDLRLRFFSLIRQTDETLKPLTIVPVQDKNAYQTFQAKILALLQLTQKTGKLIETFDYSAPIVFSNPINSDDPATRAILYNGLIPFPPGSAGAVHAFYPLNGQHALLSCSSCHKDGKYINTPNICITCHIMELPIQHYSEECSLCHTPVSWTDIIFDHQASNATECSECHEKDIPANHYSGQCSACHIIQAWEIVTFDHAVAGAVDCNSCHARLTPANHYPGQCSNCHDTSNWASVVFNHTGFTDCVSCHSGDAPVNHFSGQCSNCHSSTTWLGAVFDHSGFTDCISCHSNDAPAGHYPGQCSNCHDSGGSWANASFNHSGYTDCLACHAGDAPANHYPSQCSDCHSTNGWSGAVFNHNGLTDCISCHLKDRPNEHDAGQCSECHNTQKWDNEGDAAGLFINGDNILQNFDCQLCHNSIAVLSVKDIGQ